MNKIGYKIVLTSSMESLFSPLNLVYPLNKKIYHQIGDGGIAIFDTYENALCFYKKYNLSYKAMIFECKYKQENQYFDNIGKLFCAYDRDEKAIGFNWDDMVSFGDYRPLPCGTICCRWVKLIKLSR